MREKKLGNIWGATGGNYAGNIYDTDYAAPCLNTCEGGGRMPMIVEAYAVASRGRNPDNPSDRRAGINLEQRFELKEDGRTNTITSVQKDNYVVVTEEENEIMSHRIRKLTPTECFRLQGLTKEDAEKCTAVGVSNSQLYRQAGNGIASECVKLLIEHLFKAQFDSDYVCGDEVATAEQQEERVNGENISYCLDSNYWKGGADSMVDYFTNKKRRQLVCVNE